MRAVNKLQKVNPLNIPSPEFLSYNETELWRWFFYAPSHLAVHGLGRALLDLKTYGQENLSLSGAGIIAANHRHWKDVFILPTAVPNRHVTMVAKHESLAFFSSKGLGLYLRALGAIPVHRENPQIGELKQIYSVLGQGRLLGMFPEETREKGRIKSRDQIDLRSELKPGLGRIALSSRAKTYPTALVGMDWGLEKPQALAFGAAMDPPDHKREVGEWMDEWARREAELYAQTYEHLLAA